MIYGLNEYYNGLIEEAKSPEEIKKILEYQFVKGKGVPQDILDKVFSMDPTKKKSYTRWVLMQWDEHQDTITKAISNGRLEKMFKTFKDRASEGLDLTNIESIERALEYIPDTDPVLEKSGDPNAPENDFEIVYDTSEWTIAVPHTYEADKKLGQGCRWCTAGAFGDNDYYWNRYSSAGPLWINFDKRSHEIGPKDGKEYPYKRYQFLFEWQNWSGELMDSDDSRVDFEEIDMPSEVVDFYGNQNEKYREIIENGGNEEELWEEYNEERINRAAWVIRTPDESNYLYMMPEEDDYRNLDVDYALYSDDDYSDSPFYRRFDKDDYFIMRDAGGNSALLKDIQGNTVIVYLTSRQSSWNTTRYDFELDDIERYWELGNINVAVSDRSSKIFVMPMNDNDCQFDAVDADDVSYIENVFINKEITKVAIDNGIEGYHGYAIEIETGDEKHGLLLYDGEVLKWLIINDAPRKGEAAYSAIVENGKVVINGALFTHSFDEYGEPDSTNMKINQELGTASDGKDYYLVYTNNENSVNVYCADDRTLIFDNNVYDRILEIYCANDGITLECLRQDNGLYDAYSIDNKMFIVQNASEVAALQRAEIGGSKTLMVIMPDKTGSILSAIDRFKPIITFKKFYTSIDKSHCLLEIEDSHVVAFDIENRRITLNANGYVGFGKVGGRTCCIMLQSIEQKQMREADPSVVLVDVFNYLTGERVMKNCVNGADVFKIVPRCSELRILKNADGKYNIMNVKGELMLPGGAENIFYYSPSEFDTVGKLIVIIDKNTMWYINNNPEELLPSKLGINLNVLRPYKLDSRRLLFTYKGEYTVELNVFDNGELGVDRVWKNGEYLEDDEKKAVAAEVDRVLHQDRAAIMESFKTIFNKINNPFKGGLYD